MERGTVPLVSTLTYTITRRHHYGWDINTNRCSKRWRPPSPPGEEPSHDDPHQPEGYTWNRRAGDWGPHAEVGAEQRLVGVDAAGNMLWIRCRHRTTMPSFSTGVWRVLSWATTTLTGRASPGGETAVAFLVINTSGCQFHDATLAVGTGAARADGYGSHGCVNLPTMRRAHFDVISVSCGHRCCE